MLIFKCNIIVEQKNHRNAVEGTCTATWRQPGLSRGCVDFFVIRTYTPTLQYIEAVYGLKSTFHANRLVLNWFHFYYFCYLKIKLIEC